MATPVQMPKLGESVVEGTVFRWLKSPGDPIAKLEPLLEISTDKIDTEIPSPADGTLLEILVREGETVGVGTLLGMIGERGEKENGSRGAGEQGGSTQTESERPTGRSFISPVVARLAKEHQLNLALLTGTGLNGRITKKDVEAVLNSPHVVVQTSVAQTSAVQSPQPAAIPASAPQSETQDAILHPLTMMRRVIAQHMVHSKQTSAHVTTIFEVDMTAVVLHREQAKQALAEKGVNLTFNPYFIAAAVAGLRAVPYANGKFSEQGILVSRRLHIGIAVATQQQGEDGLLVPVIRDADEKNLAGLARTVNDLAERARKGKLSADEQSGGTFTITNHGVGGSLAGTPIINQPQAAILGIGAIVKRPVVRNGNQSLLPSADDAIVIRPMCYLSLSFDHRILDGASADRFLTVVKQTLENWKEY